MLGISRRARILTLLVLAIILLNLLAYALVNRAPAGGAGLTPAARDWPAARGVLRVAGDNNFPPFEFVDQGEYRGFNVDLMHALEVELGIPIRLFLMPWSAARAALERGDVIARVPGLVGLLIEVLRKKSPRRDDGRENQDQDRKQGSSGQASGKSVF